MVDGWQVSADNLVWTFTLRDLTWSNGQPVTAEDCIASIMRWGARDSMGRRMLAALIAGERDANTLAALALGKLRRKLPQLELALAGQFTAHHARLIQGALDRIDLLDRQIAELDQQIGALVHP